MVALNEERDAISLCHYRYYGSTARSSDCLEIVETNDEDNVAKRKCPVPVPDNDEEPMHATDPLLPLYSPPHYLSGEDEREKKLLRDEMAAMANLAAPVIMTYLLMMIPTLGTIIFVGKVQYYDEVGGVSGGDEDDEDKPAMNLSMRSLYLDAASLAIVFTNVVAMSPAIGLLNAMDTLCSQAHGARQSSKMGTYMLTGLAITSLVFLAASVIIWNASSILIALGQPMEVSLLMGDFAKYLLPGIPFLYLYELIKKVFQARNEAMPMLISAVMSNVINLSLGYYLVHCTGWGWMGAAVARSVANILLVPTLLIGVVMSVAGESRGHVNEDDIDRSVSQAGNNYEPISQTNLEVVHGKDYEMKVKENDDLEFLHHLLEGFVIKDALSVDAIVEFLSLGFPGMLQVMIEWTAFEAITFLCGILPGKEAIIGIGANTIIMNISSLTFMFYLGVSVSGNVRIGNALGAGDAHRAEIATLLTLVSSATAALFNIALLLVFRKAIPLFFTTDLDIVEKAQHVLFIVAIFQLPDAVNAAIQGIFRGSGRQALGAKVNFVTYYIIGIPLGFILGIKLGFGIEGLWWGMTAGLCAISIGCTAIVLRSDWNKLASEATIRLNR